MRLSVCFGLACLGLFVLPPAWAANGDPPTVPPVFLAAAVLVPTLLGVWLGVCLHRQRRATDQLRGQVRAYEQLIDLAPVPILRLDADFQVTGSNQEGVTRYGAEVPGQSLNQLVGELPRGAVEPWAGQESRVLPLDPGPGQGPSVLVQIATAGGRQDYWFGPVVPGPLEDLEDGAGHSPGTEGVGLMQGEFIANINHEVRTPLNAIIGYSEMLAEASLGSQEKRFADIIHKSSLALVTIFNDIMELSKIATGGLQITASAVHLPTIMTESLALVGEAAEEYSVRLHSFTAPHLPQDFVLDGVRLKQIFYNLLNNAIKFAREGSVTLAFDGRPMADPAAGWELRCTVEDTGIGITPADQAKIRALFRQRDSLGKRDSTVGLGLTLCSRLAVLMGGFITLESEEGKGARFTLTLPGVAVAQPRVVAEPRQEVVPEEQRDWKLLVVDDVAMVQGVFLDYFQDTPYTVLTAASREEALSIAKLEHPDVIFMDLNLPGTNGRAITSELRNYPGLASIPVVVMTGESLEEGDYRPLFDDLLQKPFRLDALKEIVLRYTARRAPAPSTAPGPKSQGTEDRSVDQQVANAWNDELETLFQRALYSGSLTDTAALAMAMQQRGHQEGLAQLEALGGELLLHAREPNILGLDRLLTKLSRITHSQS